MPLFDTCIYVAGDVAGFKQQYDVTPDGQRFLMSVEAEGSGAASSFTVVLNWSAGLK
jgi:hypothetical protein